MVEHDPHGPEVSTSVTSANDDKSFQFSMLTASRVDDTLRGFGCNR
jgi:hypothetical protein